MYAYSVFGLAFIRDRVILVESSDTTDSPSLWTGVGGSLSLGEPAVDALVRYFVQHTGIQTMISDWRRICTFVGTSSNPSYTNSEQFYTKWYSIRLPDDTHIPSTVYTYSLPTLSPDVLPSIRWLVPLAMDTDPHLSSVVVHYSELY